MHGLVNRSIQSFLTDSYGCAAWKAIATRADLGLDGFEAMLSYDNALTVRLLDAAAAHLDKGTDMLLEDLGTYLVSRPRVDSLRRLLRFGGASFIDFLYSLDELPERARLAVPDLDLPRLELRANGPAGFALEVRFAEPGFGRVLTGILRAMADEYGALVMLGYRYRQPGLEVLTIEVHEASYSRGRSFALSAAPP